MKQHLTATLLFCFGTVALFAQNWPTVGGNNQRNGLGSMPGPAGTNGLLWSIDSDWPTAWGNSVYLSGNRFVNTRIQLDPVYEGRLECRSVSDGALLWTYGQSGQIPYAVGFDQHAVYVHDYSNGDFLALDPQDGHLLWRHDEAVYMFGGNAGVLFACNGDPVVFGKRIDKFTGETVWATSYLIPIAPDGGFAAYEDTYYHWEGTVFTPKRLIAIDINSGQLKYKSDPMPGDPDQENPLTVGHDGTIYISRDGGPLMAFRDTGTGFDTLWTSNLGAQSRIAVGPDGSLYYFRNNRILRVDPANGQPLDTSVQALASTAPPLIAADADGRVYASNGALGTPGRYYCFSADLSQILWILPTPTNYYSGPAFGRNGVLIAVGEGTLIRAFQFEGAHRPVADFEADNNVINAGQGVDFQDFSSFSPDSWEWHFPGATPAVSSEQHPQNIVYDLPGLYDVTLITSGALGADTLTRSCLIDVRESSATGEQNAADVRAFPNPASELLRIEAPPGSRVRVWNASNGRLQTQAAAPGSIVVSDWPAGFYVVEVNHEGKVYRRKQAVVR